MKTVILTSRVLLMFCVLVQTTVLAASSIEEVSFDSEQDRARYDRMITELRCPKCTNANLAGSDAPIAHDLRAVIRDQINEGKSDEEIYDFLIARYGDFILYRPPLNSGTSFLWFAPPLLLLLGFFILRRMIKGSVLNNTEDELTAEEQQQLDSLLKQENNGEQS